jgi:hypothetical protein
MNIQKDIRVVERVNVQLTAIFVNIFNHNVLADPGLGLGSSSSWGSQTAQVNAPRQLEIGAHIVF